MFRKATTKDGNKILKLIDEALSSYNLKINPDETDKDLMDIDTNYFKNNGWFEVYEVNNQIVGSYGLYKVSDDICELRKMYLSPKYQGKGIGKLMMDKVIINANRLNYKTIILESNRKLGHAFELYKKYGFQEFIPDHLSERCDFAMKKNLNIE
mgnify:CR=1 FL=1